MSEMLSLHEAYDQVEEQLNRALDESLDPRGPDMLYDMVAGLGLPAGAVTLDVGCGDGRHTFGLARRFDLNVHGIEPVTSKVDAARRALVEEADDTALDTSAVRFSIGFAEQLPVADASVDLIWCRDVLVLVPDLDAAYAEFRRVLKPGGRALVYQMFATERLERREAGWLLPTMGCVEGNMQPDAAETAIQRAGLQIESRIILGTEWGEYDQEWTNKGAQKLLRGARLLRDPDRYIREFGRANYDIALGDCLWHVYRMIGKLSGRVYLLSVSTDQD